MLRGVGIASGCRRRHDKIEFELELELELSQACSQVSTTGFLSNSIASQPASQPAKAGRLVSFGARESASPAADLLRSRTQLVWVRHLPTQVNINKANLTEADNLVRDQEELALYKQFELSESAPDRALSKLRRNFSSPDGTLLVAAEQYNTTTAGYRAS